MFSQECTYFAIQLFISDVTKAWQVVETKLGYSAVNCPAWDKQHASDIFPTETQRTELNQCLFLYVIFWPSNLSINCSIWWRKWQNSYLWASCSTGKFTPSIAVPKHQLKIPGHFENCSLLASDTNGDRFCKAWTAFSNRIVKFSFKEMSLVDWCCSYSHNNSSKSVKNKLHSLSLPRTWPHGDHCHPPSCSYGQVFSFQVPRRNKGPTRTQFVDTNFCLLILKAFGSWLNLKIRKSW